MWLEIGLDSASIISSDALGRHFRVLGLKLDLELVLNFVFHVRVSAETTQDVCTSWASIDSVASFALPSCAFGGKNSLLIVSCNIWSMQSHKWKPNWPQLVHMRFRAMPSASIRPPRQRDLGEIIQRNSNHHHCLTTRSAMLKCLMHTPSKLLRLQRSHLVLAFHPRFWLIWTAFRTKTPFSWIPSSRYHLLLDKLSRTLYRITFMVTIHQH